jgi:hypothetical protein
MSIVKLNYQLESTSEAPSAKALGKLSGKSLQVVAGDCYGLTRHSVQRTLTD